MGAHGAAGTLRSDLRTRPPRAADARDRLLRACSEVLREAGYRAAPLEEILARSRVARSNLYYHFAGKLELAQAAIATWRGDGEAAASLAPLRDEQRRGLERIRRYFEAVEGVARAGACGDPYALLAAEGDLPEPLRQQVAAALEAIEAALESAIRAGIRDGSIRMAMDPRALARALLAAVEGASLLARAERNPGRVPACLEAVLEGLASDAGGGETAPIL